MCAPLGLQFNRKVAKQLNQLVVGAYASLSWCTHLCAVAKRALIPWASFNRRARLRLKAAARETETTMSSDHGDSDRAYRELLKILLRRGDFEASATTPFRPLTAFITDLPSVERLLPYDAALFRRCQRAVNRAPTGRANSSGFNDYAPLVPVIDLTTASFPPRCGRFASVPRIATSWRAAAGWTATY